MKLIYNDVKTEKSCYKVKVSYEHGDADVTTNDNFTFTTEEEVIEFVQDFLKCRKAVYDNCHYGVEIKDEILELLENYGEHDRIYESADLFANMSIKSITYYDIEYSCKIEE